MTYKGYSARIEFDGDDQILVGRLLGLNDIVGFHASSVEGLTEAFHEAVDDYIETCRKAGKRPEKVFSGKMMFRVPPDIHARAAFAAEMAGKSLNPWAEEVLAKAAQQNGNVQPS